MKIYRTLFVLTLFFGVCPRWLTPTWAEVRQKVILAPTWDQGRSVRVALFPVEAKASQEEGGQYLRRVLYGQLLSIPELRLIEPAVVDQLLRGKGLLENKAWKDTELQRLGQILGVDFLLLPELTDWSRRYLLVQSKISVGIRARMMDAQTGKRTWEAECKATFEKGLTGIPTGAGSLALEPLRGLRKRYLFDCAYDAAHGLVGCLQPLEPKRRRSRRSRTTLHSGQPTHRSRKSVPKPQTRVSPPLITSASMTFQNRILTLELEGTEGCAGSFFAGETDRLFPLSEVALGRYRGQYRIPKGASFTPSQVEVRLVRPDGQAVEGKVQ